MKRYDGHSDANNNEIEEIPKSASNFYYISCFFVTIASVLGTGILALPVKTVNSGFWPFFVVFIFVLIMEEAVIFFAVELMQHTHSLLSVGITDINKLARSSAESKRDERGHNSDAESGSGEPPLIPYEEDDGEGKPENNNGNEDDTSVTNTPLLNRTGKKKQVNLNLHLMGMLFLDRRARWVFDGCVYLHFVSILISYVLAASESWGQVFGVHVNCQDKPTEEQHNKLRLVIVGFGLIFTLAVVFGQRLFTSVVSVFTTVKGTLLFLMVGVTAYVAIDIDNTIVNDWSLFFDSFLMSTVALGGAVNLMPLVFNKVPQTRSDVRKYQIAISSGLFTCGIVIILWTYFVMKAVPQFGEPDEPSLQFAAKNGCISIIPLIDIINLTRPNLDWLADIIQIFIIVSVSVSFITVGSGLKNFLDGYVVQLSKNFPPYHCTPRNRVLALLTPTPYVFYQIIVYSVSFGLSIGFAIGKPSCFLVVLEYFTSMGLNLENGFFIAYMMVIANKYKTSAASHIPLPLRQPWAIRAAYVTGAFFSAAVLYDIAVFIKHVVDVGGLC